MGTEFVKEWIDQKISNQINHLNKLRLNRSDEKVELIDAAIKDMEEHKRALSMLNNVSIDI